ncbi:DUF4253 domain-containing protein [Actinomycetospora chibensis]|uniref:DUF4253 domain-containing protein n=1 Tax=Actinomycetospora chibensis TaxID=663606 RepID=A0ABV9RAU4_9PSEU|nr:DUF4253 domain-containing protein [Actinomycetospora chibensis]MDD7924198.1 DUF4253 domain-containing protein [Actinomycetospora chibensis]
MTTSDLPASDLVERVAGAGPNTYRELLGKARTTHRAPVWLGRGGDAGVGVLPVPDDPAVDVDAHDPYRVLADWWPGPCPEGCTCLEPFSGQLPGLVRAGRVDRSTSRCTVEEAAAMADEVVSYGVGVLAVVRAARPADVPAVTGWVGAGNYRHQDNVRISAVLRSWEDRFGALLVVMTESTLLLSVAYPPTTFKEAEQVAAEHFAFCPDQHDPQDMAGTVYTPRSYGRTIRKARHWRFWWD